ncbi:MAG: CPBP family intramembrane glutamic endopeptidase [Arthrobacter sp.]
MSSARVDVRSISVFVAISFGLSWLIALPLWFGEGLADPLFPLYALAMMSTPAIAALIVARWVECAAPGVEPRIARRVGLVPLRPLGRLSLYLVAAAAIPVLSILGGLLIGAAAGVYAADVLNVSGLRQLMATQASTAGVELPELSTSVLVAAQFVNIALGSLINTVPALGEELGWRGWLVPRLRPLGTAGMILVSGVIWGLWHAPLVLLGYNYAPAPEWLGLLAMCGLTISFGAVLAWLRLASGSVWPAALAHGSLNASAGLMVVFAVPGPLDTLQVAPLGWTGWIIPLALGSGLLIHLRRRGMRSENGRGDELGLSGSADVGGDRV